jgi:signal transduction histidine kinase
MASVTVADGRGDGPDIPLVPSPRAAAVLALAVAVVGAVIDWFTPANILIPIVYSIALLLAAWTRDLRFLWVLTFAVSVANIVTFVWGAHPLEPFNPVAVQLNRLLSAGQIVLVAGIVHVMILAQRTREEQRRALESQRDELESVNQELTQREEEIVRQNEELQSQAEELERQSEELRITNEELAGREKMLEQLLELSRSLTPELSRDETLKRICEALGLLVDNLPIAVLEKRANDLEVVCHQGFGPDGLESDRLPFAESFASLVMSRGQTGYLEDLKLRPELRVPQPRHGESFRAVLSAPLRVHGRCIGTVEVYSHQKQSWSDSQVVLVESLATQTAVSLGAAELIEAIQQERRRFEAAFRTVPFGMLVAEDPEARQVHVNPAGAALFGVPVGENLSPTTPVGARLRRNVSRNEQPVKLGELPLSRALRGEEVQGEELTLTLPNGKRLVLLFSAAPLYDAAGHVTGAVVAFADITVQKSLQRELEIRRREAEETSVRKTRFLAAVSHDIRTPVNAINLMAELIRRYAADPAVAPQIPELAQKLQANARSLVELVSDVLDVARFDSGKVELVESEFALGELLAEECRQLQPLARDKGLELTLEPLERPVWLRTDRVKLARVVSNLVGNAIKFTDSGSVRVSVALAPEVERRVLIRVRDTGLGIATEHMTRIFDEFAQVHNPERDRTKGTGLGLAICKRLVEVMGGAIDVDSAPGRGSTFTVALPASSVVLRLGTAPPPPPPKLPVPVATGCALVGMHILLVEDHAMTREGTARLLAGEGATVLEADDGRSALELLRKGGADVLLLDMMLPDLDGREVLKAIQAKRPPGLKGVLVLTGDLTPERLAEVQRLGADALIGKPIDVGFLAATLRTFYRGEAGP